MGLGSGIRDPEKNYSGSWIQGSKRHRIPDPQHWIRYCIFGFKFAIYSFQVLHEGRPRYRRCLQHSKENLQHFKPTHFFAFFLVIFVHLDPDPSDKNQCGSMQIRIHKTGLPVRFVFASLTWSSVCCTSPWPWSGDYENRAMTSKHLQTDTLNEGRKQTKIDQWYNYEGF